MYEYYSEKSVDKNNIINRMDATEKSVSMTNHYFKYL